MRRLLIASLSVIVLGVVAVAGAPNASALVGVEMFGLRDDGTTLVRFDSAAPGTILATTTVAGLAAGETLLGMDFRAATAQLNALTSAGRVIVVEPRTGVIVRSVTLAADPADTTAPVFTSLSGTQFAVDFNPVPDRLRVVSDTGQNLRINVDNGLTTGDLAINPAGSTITGAAYTNPTANPAPASTVLYDIDSTGNRLVVQNPPNDGTLVPTGALGVDTDGRVGFDIDASGAARASLTVGGSTGLYSIDLAAGTATLVGTIGSGSPLRGIAVAPPPAATPPTVALLAANGTSLTFVDPRNPTSPRATIAITGVTAGDTLVGIDVRPATGVLHAFAVNGSTGRIYTINTATGAATALTALAADPADTTNPYTGVTGTTFAVDFNPVPDRLRVINDADQNLRINVTTGAVTTDGPIAYGVGDPNAAMNAVVSAAAYTNSTPGTPPPASTLIDIETSVDVLAVQTPPNDGTLVTGGALGANLASLVSFDISPDNRWALLASGDGTTARLDAVELGSPIGSSAAPAGRRALFGAVGPVQGIAVLAAGAALPPGIACRPASTPPSPFVDVNPASVHAPGIACVAARGITRGTTATTFNPAGAVSRGQVASFLNRFLVSAGVTLPAGPDAFRDDDGLVHEPAINALAAAGIIAGKSPGIYDPTASVTRGQVASLLRGAYERVTGSALPAGANAFSDDEGSVHEPSINALAAAGILLGRADGQFGLDDPTRREQLATVITRALDRLVAAGFAAPI